MRITRWSSLCVAVLATGSLTACNPAEPAKQAVTDIKGGNAAACVEEKSTIEKAVQAYTLLNPDKSVSEAEMVTSGFIHEESKLMDLTPDGTVVPAAGTVCA
jgi:hypothetical protein